MSPPGRFQSPFQSILPNTYIYSLYYNRQSLSVQNRLYVKSLFRVSREKVDILEGEGDSIMSEARDRKMKRKRKLDELKAEKVLRACRSRRALANQL